MRLFFFVALFFSGSTLWAASVGQKAPLFSLQELGSDRVVDLAAYRGKVVYVDFWASWCGPCRQSFPALSDLHKRYADQGFEVIAINLDKELSAATNFIDHNPVTYPVVQGFGSGVDKLYEVKAMPSAYFVDATGTIRLVHLGFKTKNREFLEAVLQKLLAER